MKQLVRLEHSDGQGIFNGTIVSADGRDIGRRHKLVADYLCPDVYDRHLDFPRPWEDDINFKVGKHFCAYKSMAQLNEWIKPKEILIFLEVGFKVYLIEVSECLEGKHQICYEKQHILHKTDITNLFL